MALEGVSSSRRSDQVAVHSRL